MESKTASNCKENEKNASNGHKKLSVDSRVDKELLQKYRKAIRGERVALHLLSEDSLKSVPNKKSVLIGEDQFSQEEDFQTSSSTFFIEKIVPSDLECEEDVHLLSFLQQVLPPISMDSEEQEGNNSFVEEEQGVELLFESEDEQVPQPIQQAQTVPQNEQVEMEDDLPEERSNSKKQSKLIHFGLVHQKSNEEQAPLLKYKASNLLPSNQVSHYSPLVSVNKDSRLSRFGLKGMQNMKKHLSSSKKGKVKEFPFGRFITSNDTIFRSQEEPMQEEQQEDQVTFDGAQAVEEQAEEDNKYLAKIEFVEMLHNKSRSI